MKQEDEKKICFKEGEYKHASLLIRLRYDNIRQGEFFRLLIDEYLAKTPEMMSIVQKFKKESRKMGRNSIARSKADMEKSEELLEAVGLSRGEVQGLFDLIEAPDE